MKFISCNNDPQIFSLKVNVSAKLSQECVVMHLHCVNVVLPSPIPSLFPLQTLFSALFYLHQSSWSVSPGWHKHIRTQLTDNWHTPRWREGTIQYKEHTYGLKDSFSQFSLFPTVNSWADSL